MVIVLESGIGKELIPVVLVLVAEEVEILFQLLIYALCLTVRLRVVGYGGVELYSKQFIELALERPWSFQMFLWYRFVALMAEQVVWVWNEVCSLAIQVYYCYDCIVTVGIRELYNEVYRGYAPLFCKHQQQV
ncbi:hypothetical protein C0989_002473 [Termitomyces sp. Mn162]|nr:hypothetical protein C0989_002473 [Termitomyces sp. Mn162]